MAKAKTPSTPKAPPISFSELQADLQKLAKHYRLFERGLEIADALVSYDQVRFELERTIKGKTVELEAINADIKAQASSLSEAKRVVADTLEAGRQEASIIVAKAQEEYAQRMSQCDADVADARKTLADLNKHSKALLDEIGGRSVTLETINKSIETAQDKLKQFIGGADGSA